MLRTPGETIREARQRHHLTQSRLAKRAGTTQSAISRIERDRVSPSVETLSSLLHLLGEKLDLNAGPGDSGIDRTLIQERLRLTPAERVAYGLRFADLVIRNRGPRRARPPA